MKTGKPRGSHPPRAQPPFPPRGEDEAALLRAISHHDEPSREIYADWLETKGHATEAAFVRTQQAVVHGDSAQQPALVQLGAKLDARFRLRLSRPAIENCGRVDVPKFDFKCPKEWGALEPTPDQAVRHCGACKESVHYTTNIVDARDLAAEGKCVAIDLGAERWRGDLAGPFNVENCRYCDGDLGTYAGDDCPRCKSPRRMMVVGRMPSY